MHGFGAHLTADGESELPSGAHSRWALVLPEALAILDWEDGSVMFNERESTTVMLSAEAGLIVRALCKAPADARTLAALTAGRAGDSDDIEALLASLSLHGIVREFACEPA